MARPTPITKPIKSELRPITCGGDGFYHKSWERQEEQRKEVEEKGTKVQRYKGD